MFVFGSVPPSYMYKYEADTACKWLVDRAVIADVRSHRLLGRTTSLAAGATRRVSALACGRQVLCLRMRMHHIASVDHYRRQKAATWAPTACSKAQKKPAQQKCMALTHRVLCLRMPNQRKPMICMALAHAMTYRQCSADAGTLPLHGAGAQYLESLCLTGVFLPDMACTCHVPHNQACKSENQGALCLEGCACDCTIPQLLPEDVKALFAV